jgi:hypothetical protein
VTPEPATRRALNTGSLAVTALAVACMASVLALAPGSGDYQLFDQLSDSVGDNPAPAIDALVDGRIGAALDLHPWMGSLSLLLRWPFAAAGEAVGLGELAVYKLGALVCFIALGLLALALDRRLAAQGRSLTTRLIASGAMLINPATVSAVGQGHPEELLTTALCVGAVLVAPRRPIAAALLLGLALATKQWALVALPVVIVAARPGGRWRLALTTIAIAGAITLPLVVGAPDRLWSIVAEASSPATLAPANVWAPFAETRMRTYFDGEAVRTATGYAMPRSLQPFPRPLILLAPIVLSLLALRRGRLSAVDAVGLLALCFLLRCLLDPVNLAYYYVPFLTALVSYESLRWERPPILTLLAAAGVWVTFNAFDDRTTTSVAWALWALPMALSLAVLVLGRRDPGPTELANPPLNSPA